MAPIKFHQTKRALMLVFVLTTLLINTFSGFSDEQNTAATEQSTTATLQISSEKVAMKDIIQALIAENTAPVNRSLFPAKTAIKDYSNEAGIANINFSKEFALQPIRPETIEKLNELFLPLLKTKDDEQLTIKYTIENDPIESLIPRWYLSGNEKEANLKTKNDNPPIQTNIDRPYKTAVKGLYSRHIALWPSHGWYFDATQNKRWEWQRPRMFTISEDTQQMAFVNQYLMPMLENAGAVVFSARERDFQKNEIVIDNDDMGLNASQGVYSETGEWTKGEGAGFKNSANPYEFGVNPHEQGTNRIAFSSSKATAKAVWTPNIPEDGEYGVTISYKHNPEKSASSAHYAVNHAGGTTNFLVNQKMGGGTWVYLGKFYFKKGMNQEKGSVTLTNDGRESEKIVSADAVRFGGGMGNITRGGDTSGYPRYLEAALYWMQYAGAPAKIVYDLGLEDGAEGPDYTNDYAGRSEFVNWLNGNPAGPNSQRENPGLGIPIDCCIGLHTDAGISKGIIGFLSIYYIQDQLKNITFPDGRPRTLNRELADLVQTETINTLQSKYTSTWTRRELKNSSYAEARRPNVPSCLTEGLSHQNYNDMKYYLDPRFRFDYARGVYKGILKFIASEYNFEPVVQPLAPVDLCLKKNSEDSAILSWQPQLDPLEPSAEPEGYIVYSREADGGFDNGVFASRKACTLKKLKQDALYSFKVTAVNKGGESFPSETLSICLGRADAQRILIVNGFDRISAPPMGTGDMQGPRRDIDRGVGYMMTTGLTGDQWDFNPASKFLTNDNPGHGASYGDLEDKIELGNTFDFVSIHGKSIAAGGYGFDSASHSSVENETIELSQYKAVDWLLGEQREVLPPSGFEEGGMPDKMKPEFKTFNEKAKEKIKQYLASGGAIFISGAYIATDLTQSAGATDDDKNFLSKTLKAEWSTNFGSRTNNVITCADSPFKMFKEFHFASGIGENGVYGVEAPDAMDPAKDSGAVTAFRYKDARFSAGIAYKGSDYSSVVLGFPFETITDNAAKNQLMAEVLKYLIKE